ncbi:MAG: glycosyltransferase family 4 protein [Phycisphaerae bacterium]|nr:glycosyltransferase family 4 protein [Phycisphaerae bacterium]
MRIVWHMPTLRRKACGLSARALALAKRLGRYGNAITFVVDRDKTDVTNDQIEGMPLRRVSVGTWRPVHWCAQARARRRAAASAVRQMDTDHGLNHDLVISCQPEAVLAYAAVRNRRPVVYVCGGTTVLHDGADRTRQASLPAIRRLPYAVDRYLKRRNESQAFAAADMVVFDSLHTRELVIASYGAEAARCHTVHGGVDEDMFRQECEDVRSAARRRLGIRPGGIVVVWTGRLSPEKNVGLLLRSLPHCRPRPDRVLLVGDGPERDVLVDLSDALGLDDIVEFTGEHDDVRPFLRAADIFAFPSCGESFGGALVEAMACGLASVALRPDGRGVCNANLEIIEHNRCGLLVDPPTPAAFAEALDHLARDDGRRRRFGAAGRERARRHFTWEAGARRLNELISELTQPETRPRIRAKEVNAEAYVVTGLGR